MLELVASSNDVVSRLRRGWFIRYSQQILLTADKGTLPNPPVTRRQSRAFRRRTPHLAPIARCQYPRRSPGQSTGSRSANTPPRSVTADSRRTANLCGRDSIQCPPPRTTLSSTSLDKRPESDGRDER